MPTCNDLRNFHHSFSSMYKSKKKLMREEVEEKLEELKKESLNSRSLDYEEWVKWHENYKPRASGWHWVWCIVANNTMAMTNIPEEIWNEALQILKKYQEGQIIDKQLFSFEEYKSAIVDGVVKKIGEESWFRGVCTDTVRDSYRSKYPLDRAIEIAAADTEVWDGLCGF